MTSFLSSAQVTCTFITRTKTGIDTDGNDVFGTSSVAVPGCLFAPGGGSETLGNQDTVVDQPTLYVPTGTAVPSPIDAITVPGLGMYEIDGSPSQWPSNATGYSIVIKLKAVSG